jgi:hypothetical protein
MVSGITNAHPANAKPARDGVGEWVIIGTTSLVTSVNRTCERVKKTPTQE